MCTITRTFISPKQLESTFYRSFDKIDNKIGQVDIFQLVPTRGQPATIIPRPARVMEILQGAYFPDVSHSVLQ